MQEARARALGFSTKRSTLLVSSVTTTAVLGRVLHLQGKHMVGGAATT